MTPPLQNRAYAASQLSDLAAKIHKAHSGSVRNLSSVGTATAILGDLNIQRPDMTGSQILDAKGKGTNSLTGGGDAKKTEEGVCDQIVRDRFAYILHQFCDVLCVLILLPFF
jgi:hypothetical protein